MVGNYVNEDESILKIRKYTYMVLNVCDNDNMQLSQYSHNHYYPFFTFKIGSVNNILTLILILKDAKDTSGSQSPPMV